MYTISLTALTLLYIANRQEGSYRKKEGRPRTGKQAMAVAAPKCTTTTVTTTATYNCNCGGACDCDRLCDYIPHCDYAYIHWIWNAVAANLCSVLLRILLCAA